VVREISNVQANSVESTFNGGMVSIIGTTAAEVTVSGRVLKANGKGINGATVTITDILFGNTWTTLTNPKGYYRFDGIEAGRTYLVQAKAKKEQFALQVIIVMDNLSEINFIGR
jgi:hypothetical protein